MISGDARLPLGRYLDRTVRKSVLLRADWTVPPHVHAFTTFRRGLDVGVSRAPFDTFNLGTRCGDDPDAVVHNRAALQWIGELPSLPHWLRQVHGAEVVRIDACASSATSAGETEGSEPQADAAVTATPGAVLAILTADCLPVVFASDDGSEVGAAHAGWRGLCAGVLERTVAAMHAPNDRLIAWLGPAAGPQTYEIGEEVFDAFVTRDPRAAQAFVATRPGHWRVDLYALARQRLADVGITRVFGGGLCTISDSQSFFSHRRDRRTGRMATLVWRSE